MGSEDLFKKRKAKTFKELQRRKPTRSQFKKILIVCEGEKTEPYYFQEARDHYRINPDLMVISGDCSSSPDKVFQYGQSIFQEAEKTGDPFDKVFIVIDKDSHESYARVTERIQKIRPSGIFHLINSVPCFEYWLLLHYRYTSSPFASSSEIIKQLKDNKFIYIKGQKDVFRKLLPKLDMAIRNSKRAVSEAQRNNTDMPSTKIHELIEYIQKELIKN